MTPAQMSHVDPAVSSEVLELLETTREWKCFQEMSPSGSMRAPTAPIQSLPSGAESTNAAALIRGGVVFGFVLAAGAITPVGETRAVVRRDLSPTVPRAQVPVVRRRETDAINDSSFSADFATSADSALPAAREPREVRIRDEREIEGVAASAQDEGELEAITPQARVSAIQDALSLSVTQLAAILRVTRSTIYAWISGDVVALRENTRTRLANLYRVARRWRARTGEPLGQLVALPLGDGEPSLLGLLTERDIEDPAIEQAMQRLGDVIDMQEAERRSARMRAFGRTRTSSPEDLELDRLRDQMRGLR